jgi:hypothetical protein
MGGTQEGNALTIGDLQQVVPMTFGDKKAEEQLRARLRRARGALKVRITPTEQPDVEGHAMDTTMRSVWLRLQLDDDDTEGHAISVHFPTAVDADRFRRNLLAAGLLAGTIVVGSAGAIAVSSLPSAVPAGTPAAQSQVYERPAGSGMLRGADIAEESSLGAAAAIPSQAPATIDEATGKPARSGFQEGADIGTAQPGSAPTASPTVERPAGVGPLEGVDR